MPDRIESLRALCEAGYLPLHHYVAARREYLMAELAAQERRLQNLVLSPFDRWEAEEYAKDLRRELNGEKSFTD
jgi:hypothetical protein